MLRKFFVLIFIYSGTVSAQVLDSISTELKIYPDTISIKPDSLFSNDSLLTIIQPDSIAPVYANAFTEKSFIIKNSELTKLEYQYTGDYLRAFPLTFIKNLGFTGQPNETFLYGAGNGAVSFLIDGISYNNRILNSLNLNLIQSEDVDSIEIIPLPRGFLYGTFNNPVSVNFITKDFIQSQPYTRIRFYQGVNRDMMLDGSFNAMILNRLIASFDITNRIFDGTYKNSGYSIWQGKIKLKYLLSNSVNIIASYNYNDYNAGYNGGVDVDSILASGNDPDKVMYDFRSAPMRFENGQLKTLTHLPRLRFLIKPNDWMKTDASLYFLFNRVEINNSINEYYESKTYGFNLKNDANWNVLNFQFNADYEIGKPFYQKPSEELPSPAYNFNEQNEDLFSLSGILSVILPDSQFIPSLFIKTLNLNRSSATTLGSVTYKDNTYGYGIDFLIGVKPSFKFYFGASYWDIGYSLLEVGARFNEQIIKADIKYFINNYETKHTTGGIFFDTFQFGKLSGVGAQISLNFGRLFLESNSSYYFTNSSSLTGVPEYQTQTGLYYKSILFNDNLDLKTGFVLYYTGENTVYTFENGKQKVPSSYKIDFTLAGEIQKTAIVYFVWQNLLDNDYYITPYYPMPSRSIRFGVAWEMFN